jgi:hypothetical protein
MKIVLVLCSFTILLISCRNNASSKESGDTAKRVTSNTTPPDSTLAEDEETEDCYSLFFNPQGKIDSNNIIVIGEDGGQAKLSTFIEEQGLEKEYTTIAFKDLDKDATEELWIRNFTMGAHCCDEWYVFLKQPNGKFKQAAKLSAGNTCVKDSIFTFTFDEPFGYFMSCFACGFDDSAKGFVMMREISLRFTRGKFKVIPYTTREEAQLMKNLQILKQEGVGKIEERMDNGVRKEFAINFAVYHYNHGKDLNATKRLFDEYYVFKDAKKVWKEFVSHLEDVKEYNGI